MRAPTPRARAAPPVPERAWRGPALVPARGESSPPLDLATTSPASLLAIQRLAGNTAAGHLVRRCDVRVHRCGDHPCDCADEPSVQRLTDVERLEDLASPTFAGDPRLEEVFDNAPPMRQGETGDPVKKVQRALMDDGFVMRRSVDAGGPDGDFGSETARIVRAFQRKHALGVDGVVGRQTLGRLDALELATGGTGRGGGTEVQTGDTGFEVRGKRGESDQVPGSLFFAENSAVLDAEEQAKIAALAAPADVGLTLRGLRSEDEDPALATARGQAVDAALDAAGHTGPRNLDPRPAAGEGRLEYREVRQVEVIRAGATGSTPDCSAGPVVATTVPNAFTEANDRAIAMIDDALGKLATPTAEAVALVTALFRRAGSRPTVMGKLRALKGQLQRWTATGQHRFHSECDGTCVGNIAYIAGEGNRPLTLCPIFMSTADVDHNAGTLIHEGTHREPRLDTDDHAYLFERVIFHISASEALDNADSYTALVRNLVTPGSEQVGPEQPDVAGIGLTDPGELAQANQAIAFAEKWVSANTTELGSLYSTIVESRPGGRWTNGYLEDTMRLVSKRFGFTRPPALPTPQEQQAIAGISDRNAMIHSFFGGPIAFDRSDTAEAVSVGPGRRLTLTDGFFRLTAEQRVHHIITAVIQRVPTIPVDQQPKYQTMMDDIRRHFGAPRP